MGEGGQARRTGVNMGTDPVVGVVGKESVYE